MDDDPVPETGSGIEDHVGMYQRIRADVSTGTHYRMGPDPHPVAHHRSGLHHGVGTDGDALPQVNTLAHPAHTQTPLGTPWTVGKALVHAYEELAQHLGHLDITVDIVDDFSDGQPMADNTGHQPIGGANSTVMDGWFDDVVERSAEPT